MPYGANTERGRCDGTAPSPATLAQASGHPPVAAAGVGQRDIRASDQAPFLNDTLLHGACHQAPSLALSEQFPTNEPRER